MGTLSSICKRKINLKQLRIDLRFKKAVAFLYTNNEISEKEIKETVPFPIISKRVKHLGMNL